MSPSFVLSFPVRCHIEDMQHVNVIIKSSRTRPGVSKRICSASVAEAFIQQNAVPPQPFQWESISVALFAAGSFRAGRTFRGFHDTNTFFFKLFQLEHDEAQVTEQSMLFASVGDRRAQQHEMCFCSACLHICGEFCLFDMLICSRPQQSFGWIACPVTCPGRSQCGERANSPRRGVVALCKGRFSPSASQSCNRASAQQIARDSASQSRSHACACAVSTCRLP